MKLSSWIAEYEAYLHISGYAPRNISRRMKHLSCLEPFLAGLGLKSLEDFGPEQNANFVEYWVRHGLCAKAPAKQRRKSPRRKCRFRPQHHYAVQQSLRSFFRWARAAGRMQRETFPWKAPVRGTYFLLGTADYIEFCREHKGLSENSLLQIELFVRCLDHFLHAERLMQWNQIESHHIDRFVRQQAGKKIKRIQRIHKILRGLFRFLFSLGLLTRDWGSALPFTRLANTTWLTFHVPSSLTRCADCSVALTVIDKGANEILP
jgi:hypothetical protein